MSAADNAARKVDDNPSSSDKGEPLFPDGYADPGDKAFQYIEQDDRQDTGKEKKEKNAESRDEGSAWDSIKGFFGWGKKEKDDALKDLDDIDKGKVGEEPINLTNEEKSAVEKLRSRVYDASRKLETVNLRKAGSPADQLVALDKMYDEWTWQRLHEGKHNELSNEVDRIYQKLLQIKGARYGRDGKYNVLTDEENAMLKEAEGRNFSDNDVLEMIEGKRPWHEAAYSHAIKILEAEERAPKKNQADKNDSSGIAGAGAAVASGTAFLAAAGSMLAGAKPDQGPKPPDFKIGIDHKAIIEDIYEKIAEAEKKRLMIDQELEEALQAGDVLSSLIDISDNEIERKISELSSQLPLICRYAASEAGAGKNLDEKSYLLISKRDLNEFDNIEDIAERLERKLIFLKNRLEQATRGLTKQRDEAEKKKSAIDAERLKLTAALEIEKRNYLRTREPEEAKRLIELEEERQKLVEKANSQDDKERTDALKKIAELDEKIGEILENSVAPIKAKLVRKESIKLEKGLESGFGEMEKRAAQEADKLRREKEDQMRRAAARVPGLVKSHANKIGADRLELKKRHPEEAEKIDRFEKKLAVIASRLEFMNKEQKKQAEKEMMELETLIMSIWDRIAEPSMGETEPVAFAADALDQSAEKFSIEQLKEAVRKLRALHAFYDSKPPEALSLSDKKYLDNLAKRLNDFESRLALARAEEHEKKYGDDVIHEPAKTDDTASATAPGKTAPGEPKEPKAAVNAGEPKEPKKDSKERQRAKKDIADKIKAIMDERINDRRFGFKEAEASLKNAEKIASLSAGEIEMALIDGKFMDPRDQGRLTEEELKKLAAEIANYYAEIKKGKEAGKAPAAYDRPEPRKRGKAWQEMNAALRAKIAELSGNPDKIADMKATLEQIDPLQLSPGNDLSTDAMKKEAASLAERLRRGFVKNGYFSREQARGVSDIEIIALRNELFASASRALEAGKNKRKSGSEPPSTDSASSAPADSDFPAAPSGDNAPTVPKTDAHTSVRDIPSPDNSEDGHTKALAAADRAIDELKKTLDYYIESGNVSQEQLAANLTALRQSGDALGFIGALTARDYRPLGERLNTEDLDDLRKRADEITQGAIRKMAERSALDQGSEKEKVGKKKITQLNRKIQEKINPSPAITIPAEIDPQVFAEIEKTVDKYMSSPDSQLLNDIREWLRLEPAKPELKEPPPPEEKKFEMTPYLSKLANETLPAVWYKFANFDEGAQKGGLHFLEGHLKSALGNTLKSPRRHEQCDDLALIEVEDPENGRVFLGIPVSDSYRNIMKYFDSPRSTSSFEAIKAIKKAAVLDANGNLLLKGVVEV